MVGVTSKLDGTEVFYLINNKDLRRETWNIFDVEACLDCVDPEEEYVINVFSDGDNKCIVLIDINTKDEHLFVGRK